MDYDASNSIRNMLKNTAQYYFNFNNESKCHIQDLEASEKEDRFYSFMNIPWDGYPVYCTSDYISILFIEGAATIVIDNQRTVCFGGNIFFFRNHCKFVVEPELGTEIYMVCYKKDLLDTLFISQIADCPIIYDFLLLENTNNEFLYFDCSKDMSINYISKCLQLELCSTDLMSDKTVRCSTILFLSNLHRIHRPNLVISESSMMKIYLIGNILKYMANHYSTATLANTAAHFNYNPAYFSTMFQKKALCSFTTKMQEIRLEQARRLLATTALSIQKISENIGFREKSYFYRCFKDAYGVTPGAYRREVQVIRNKFPL